MIKLRKIKKACRGIDIPYTSDTGIPPGFSVWGAYKDGCKGEEVPNRQVSQHRNFIVKVLNDLIGQG